MIERGLSKETISQLRRMKAAGLFADTEYAFEVSQHLDKLDREDRRKETLDMIKLLQIFIDPDMFKTVYRDDIDKQKLERAEKMKSIDPSKVDMDSVRELLGSIRV